MKFAQTIIALVTSLAFINVTFSAPLTSNPIPSNVVKGIATPNKLLSSGTSAESNLLQKRQSQQQLHDILRDMDGVVSKLGAQNRADFTQKLIKQLFAYNGLYSYVVCHVKHKYSFQGTEGVDWAHYKTTFHDYQYDIVIGTAGSFTLQGNGGDTNWAYSTAWAKSVTNYQDGTTTVEFVESS